jgi:hypothetical protein
MKWLILSLLLSTQVMARRPAFEQNENHGLYHPNHWYSWHLTSLSWQMGIIWGGAYPYETQENQSGQSVFDLIRQTNQLPFAAQRALARPLSAATACRTRDFVSRKPVPAAAQGARIFMATMYQSCEAPEITVPDSLSVKMSPVSKSKSRSLPSKKAIEKYRQFNPYLAHGQEEKEGCFPVQDNPPIYGYGAKATMNKSGEINLHRNQAAKGICGDRLGKSGVSCSSKPVTAIDCSGLILASLKRMGLKMKPNEDHHPAKTGTAGLASIAGSKNSCFEYVKASEDKSIDVGDIINIGSNHVVMVDEVGPDPLGIKKHMANNSCRNISVKDFDFKFIHSGALGHLGVARVNATHPEIAGFMQRLAVKAQAACNNLKKEKELKIATSKGSGISVFRHLGEKKKGCKGEPTAFENESCIEGCRI